MKALVTGGGGFLGGAIVRLLVQRGDSVRSLSRGKYPELEALGVETLQGDLADSEALVHAASGCDVVFHVAAKAGVWGSYEDYHRTNVTGTENVVQACKKAAVRRLVYTSSPSIVFKGRDESGVDESTPYAQHFLCAYPQTKALAERIVLGAGGPELSVCALRPHLIWGPRDPNLVPRIVDRARSGRLRLVGDGTNLVDSVYVDNAAEAHILAADRLAPGAACAGKAYFITNGEPLPMAELINRILTAAGLPPVTRSISAGAAYAAGAVLETIGKALGRTEEPLMTRFVARQLSTAHWFNISAALRDLGYSPRISIDEGMSRLKSWFEKPAGGTS